MTSNRNIFYDVLRVLACLMVIVIHAPRPDSGLSALTCTSVSLFCAPCMGLFFMISGALLLPVSDSYFAFASQIKQNTIPYHRFQSFLYRCFDYFERI